MHLILLLFLAICHEATTQNILRQKRRQQQQQRSHSLNRTGTNDEARRRRTNEVKRIQRTQHHQIHSSLFRPVSVGIKNQMARNTTKRMKYFRVGIVNRNATKRQMLPSYFYGLPAIHETVRFSFRKFVLV